MKVATHFVARWQVFWATTYTFDLNMFDGFWFSRLGDPPLNATVLGDELCLARVWESVPTGELWRLKRVNRDYLVRAVPMAGAFHPKTYFFANERGGVLLVGSGNLGARGLDEGHEVFCQFDSGDEQSLAALRAWRDWMDKLVTRLDDREVTARWVDAKRRAPWLIGKVGPSLFVSNWDRSLIDQLCDGITAPVDELYVMAPFYDEGATALSSLIETLRPRAITLYQCRGMSVDGSRLVSVLLASGARIVAMHVDEFVHAKLLGVAARERCRLLSGSANLSRSALLGIAGADGSANAEAGILIDLPLDRMRAAFVPPNLTVSEVPIERLASNKYEPPEETAPAVLRLQSAAVLPDASVEVRCRGLVPERASLTNGGESQRLAGNRTLGPLARDDNAPLVWIVDEADVRLSNRIPLDDPQSLRQFLTKREQRSTRPPLVDIRDLETPVGRMLERLHRECIFDIDDTPAAHSVERESHPGDEQDDFWARLLRDELRLDPRVDRYGGGGFNRGLPVEDDLFGFLAMMRDQVPPQTSIGLVGGELEQSTEGTGQRWSPERRLQVRLFNVLSRWSRALDDPRLGWLHRTAPVRNYAALLAAILECWAQRFLSEERLVELVHVLFGSFIRTERRRGYLTRLEENDLAEALDAIRSSKAADAAAALCYVALRPGISNVTSYVFDCQPFLMPGLSTGAILATDYSVDIVTGILRTTVTLDSMKERLSWAATYLDDFHWCQRTARQLDLEDIRLTTDRVAGSYGVTLEVRGLSEGVADPRLIRLVRQALDYRHVNGAVVSFNGDKVSIAISKPIAARVHGSVIRSAATVTDDLLASLEAGGLGVDALLVDITKRAS